MEVAEADSSLGYREEFPGSPAENSNDGSPSTKHVRLESPIDEVLLMNDILPCETEIDASMSIEVDRIYYYYLQRYTSYECIYIRLDKQEKSNTQNSKNTERDILIDKKGNSLIEKVYLLLFKK